MAMPPKQFKDNKNESGICKILVRNLDKHLNINFCSTYLLPYFNAISKKLPVSLPTKFIIIIIISCNNSLRFRINSFFKSSRENVVYTFTFLINFNLRDVAFADVRTSIQSHDPVFHISHKMYGQGVRRSCEVTSVLSSNWHSLISGF